MNKYFRDFDHPWVKSLNFKDVSIVDLSSLSRIRDTPSGRPSAWVLDLDSTLFCVAPRIRDIFFEFLRQHSSPPLEWQKAVLELQSATQRYDIEATFREIFLKFGLESPELRARELWQAFESFWRSRFFSERHMHFDEAYPGAVEFVHSLLSDGHEIVYLTARDIPRTAGGTRAALKREGFPLTDSTHLYMKAFAEESDLVFKRRMSSVLKSCFEVQAFIDNEPENLVMAAREFPEAHIVLFHTVMSHRVPTEDVIRYLGERSLLRLSSYSRGQQ